MVTKSAVKLIFVAKYQKENGSLTTEEISRVVKCDTARTFSANYYFEKGREMRDAMNLQIAEHNARDIHRDGKDYSLTYVEWHGQRYTVMNILNAFTNFQNDPYRKVLDCKKTL